MEGLKVGDGIPGNIHGKMALAMKSINAIPKVRQPNEKSGIKFFYRGIDDLYNAFHSIFAEVGIFVTIEDIALFKSEEMITKKEYNGVTKDVVNAIRGAIYTIKFVADDGSFVTTKSLGEGYDQSDKASGKATSYAMKSALIHTFLVPTVDLEDPDEDNPDLTGDKPGEYKTPPVASLKDKVIAFMQVSPPVFSAEWIAYADEMCKKNDIEGMNACIAEAEANMKARAPK